MKIVFQEWRKCPAQCWMMVGALICRLGSSALASWLTILLTEIFAGEGEFSTEMTKLILILVGSIVANAVGTYWHHQGISGMFTRTMDRFVTKILRSDYNLFTKYSTAYINTASEFINSAAQAGRGLITIIYNIGDVFIIIASMMIVSRVVTIPVLIIYGIGVLIFWWIFHKFGDIDKRKREAYKKRNQELENVIMGFIEVRAFHKQDDHEKSLKELNHKVFELNRDKTKILSQLFGTIELVSSGGIVGVVFYALKQIGEKLLTQSQAMSLIMFVTRLANPLVNLLDWLYDLTELLSKKDDYSNIVNWVNDESIDGSMTWHGLNDRIELKNVSFAYDDSSDVLHGIDMVIPKGSKVAIVGTSGGGKSTIFKLLNKMFGVKDGAITVDGININDLSNESYYKHIGAVHQENIIYPTTIRENIMYANPNATEEEFMEACKKTKVWDFVKDLDKRFDTEVGPRGIKLSGGQKQRIALARLFLRNPEVILLDEATSALDNESETAIQEAIDQLQDKTIISIAHRLSTIRNSDMIYVLGTGEIIEKGNHDQLMQRRGAYFDMQK